MHVPVALRKLLLMGLALVVILPFQNCSFNPEHMADLSSRSSGNVSDGIATANRFEAAKRVLQNNCASCHYAGAPGGNFNFQTEAEYRSANLITAGSVSTSKLITRLRNYTGQIDGRNMPPNSPISAQDYATLTAWVSQMPLPANNDAFTCSPNEAAATLDARRLSKSELLNSLRLILSRPFGATEAEQILTGSAATFLDRVPADNRAPFSRSDRAFESGHADAMFDFAEEVANAMTNSNRYSRLVTTFVNYAPGACTGLNVTALSNACRDAFINNFLTRVWGRPLEPGSNELASYQAEFASGTSTQAVNNLVFRAFLSPQFLNHIYTDITPVAGEAARLSTYAVARRLSYHFRLAGLDESLLQMAATTDLTQDTNYALALNAVSQNPTAMLQDFTDDWLKLHRIGSIASPNSPKWAHVTAGLTVDSGMRSAMRQEILDLVSYLYRDGRPVQEMLTTNVAFTRHAGLMSAYGQTTAAPTTFNETTAVRLPAAQRAGILTRAGYLHFSGESERPVVRGLHVMDDFLCTEVRGQSPPNAVTTPLPNGLYTTREKYEQVTAGAACIGCHAQINPIGNAFAKYNAFGKFQDVEPIFVDGTFRQNLATNSQVSLAAALQTNETMDDGVEFSQWIATSANFRACFAKKYHTYTQRLATTPTSTASCDMRRMSQVISNNGSLVDVLRAPATDARFRRRNLTQ